MNIQIGGALAIGGYNIMNLFNVTISNNKVSNNGGGIAAEDQNYIGIISSIINGNN